MYVYIYIYDNLSREIGRNFGLRQGVYIKLCLLKLRGRSQATGPKPLISQKCAFDTSNMHLDGPASSESYAFCIDEITGFQRVVWPVAREHPHNSEGSQGKCRKREVERRVATRRGAARRGAVRRRATCPGIKTKSKSTYYAI